MVVYLPITINRLEDDIMKKIMMTALAMTSLLAFADDLSEKISRYESSQGVKKTLNHLHNNVLASSEGMCATYVRKGYQASGLFSGSPGINYAKDYKPFFQNEGWTDLFSNVKSDLNNTPSGCAVVYDGINPKNDRNGYIGHIEVRTKGRKASGYISDYFSQNPRTGLECVKKGKVVKKLKTFTARDSSPFHKAGKTVSVYINVTTCAQYSKKGAIVSDEFLNRKVIGVFCKLD
jgi:hypothetical protein